MLSTHDNRLHMRTWVVVLFQDSRGNLHIITHNQATHNVCGDASDHGTLSQQHWTAVVNQVYTWSIIWAWYNSIEWMNATGCGAHIFSADGYSWTVSRTPVYDVGVELYNGSKATLQTRQRPQILFGPDGKRFFNRLLCLCMHARAPKRL